MNKVDEAFNKIKNWIGIPFVVMENLLIIEKHIKELEEEVEELTKYYDKNKDYEQQYNVVVNKLKQILGENK